MKNNLYSWSQDWRGGAPFVWVVDESPERAAAVAEAARATVDGETALVAFVNQLALFKLENEVVDSFLFRNSISEGTEHDET
jgi:hypothetical protein